MRKVIVYKWERVEGKPHCEKVQDGIALFHEWGCDYEEFEMGPGNYATAIIERPDGTVENVQADMIRFVNPPD